MIENLDNDDKFLESLTKNKLLRYVAYLEVEYKQANHRIKELEEEKGILQDQLDAHCEGCEFIKH